MAVRLPGGIMGIMNGNNQRFQPYNSLRLQSNAIPGLWKPWEGAFLGMVSMYFDDANLVDWASSKGA